MAGCSAQNAGTGRFSPVTQSHATPLPAHGNVTVASWYGPGFNGRRTSNGEIFHQDGLTAASRTLPLGSRVRVTNLSNGRSVVVRINDRGPYVRGRGLDLSKGAAQEIGLTREGVARVQVSAVNQTGSSTPAPTLWKGKVRVKRRTYHYARAHSHYRYRNSGSHRMVANPVGDWILQLMS
ncbi:MAG: septal ring lytic transglycosylase RlpA family protein [Candidatus Binataceae bacterium]|nr:septal ring lytic transglycosylase RlpA family protein [Candidatus Binataceae bacterium]